MKSEQKNSQEKTAQKATTTKPTGSSKSSDVRQRSSSINTDNEKPVIRQIPIDGNADTNMRIIEIATGTKRRYTMAYGNVGLLKQEEMLEANNDEEALKCIGKLQHILTSETWLLIERMACVIANGKQA